MTHIEKIKTKNFFYKMGVMCGSTLYYTYKFDDFEKMMQEAKKINDKYKSDMRYCTFVIQSFKDASYDFKNSCFSQIKLNINDVEAEIDTVARKILKEAGVTE